MKMENFKKVFKLGYKECLKDIEQEIIKLREVNNDLSEPIICVNDLDNFVKRSKDGLKETDKIEKYYVEKYNKKSSANIETNLSVIPNYLFCYRTATGSVFEEGKLYKIKTRQDGVQYIQLDNDEYEYYLANIQSALFVYVHIDDINKIAEEYYNPYVCIKKENNSKADFTIGRCYVYNCMLHTLETDKKPEKIFSDHLKTFCKNKKIELMEVEKWQV